MCTKTRRIRNVYIKTWSVVCVCVCVCVWVRVWLLRHVNAIWISLSSDMNRTLARLTKSNTEPTIAEMVPTTQYFWKINKFCNNQNVYVHHHHHQVPEGLGVFPVPWSSRWSWSLHLFLCLPMFLRPFVLYCSACFGNLFVSILCICCSHFFWYCFISFTVFSAPVFCLIHWFLSLSSFVIPSKCLKNF